jgi:predicted molibdopterin-dependent oxidoreductase YjgC
MTTKIMLKEEKLISLTIDGQKVQTQPGTSVLDAALANNIDVPRLCHHPELSISGGCRMCIVNVEGRQDPTISCSLVCEDGMSIETQNEELKQTRRELIDLFISEHPLDCVTCEKSGDCQLQKYAYELDITETSHPFEIARPLYQDDNPFFIRDHQYCIMCGKCVRVCDEVVGANAIDFVGRGFKTYVGTPFDVPMADSSCVFCGNCVQVCPTAALMPVSRSGKGREWELDRVETICGYCGVGCKLEFATKDNEIIYADGQAKDSVNNEFLCTKGRYGWDFYNSPDRLTSPMIRKDVACELGLTKEAWTLPDASPLSISEPNIEDSFIPVDWDTALDFVGKKLASIVNEYGSDSVMGLSSARCTNEENYIFQKFMRAGIGTNNLDHCARL